VDEIVEINIHRKVVVHSYGDALPAQDDRARSSRGSNLSFADVRGPASACRICGLRPHILNCRPHRLALPHRVSPAQDLLRRPGQANSSVKSLRFNGVSAKSQAQFRIETQSAPEVFRDGESVPFWERGQSPTDSFRLLRGTVRVG
jgi:hypothetical protein